MKYFISERQNVNSRRDAESCNAKSLIGAKIAATRKQCFDGTVLVILLNGSIVSFKDPGSRWTDLDECYNRKN